MADCRACRRSSVVERTLGKGEVECSIHSGGTRFPDRRMAGTAVCPWPVPTKSANLWITGNLSLRVVPLPRKILPSARALEGLGSSPKEPVPWRSGQSGDGGGPTGGAAPRCRGQSNGARTLSARLGTPQRLDRSRCGTHRAVPTNRNGGSAFRGIFRSGETCIAVDRRLRRNGHSGRRFAARRQGKSVSGGVRQAPALRLPHPPVRREAPRNPRKRRTPGKFRFGASRTATTLPERPLTKFSALIARRRTTKSSVRNSRKNRILTAGNEAAPERFKEVASAFACGQSRAHRPLRGAWRTTAVGHRRRLVRNRRGGRRANLRPVAAPDSGASRARRRLP